MNIEKIKEALTSHFIGTLASLEGYKVEKPYIDFGVDMTIEKISQLKYKNRKRYFNSGKIISLQLKCTTQKSIKFKANHLKFNLKTKNYNDLVERFKLRHIMKKGSIAHVLVLLVLSDKKEDWIDYSPGGFFFNGQAFWFYPNINSKISKNKFTEQISIPLRNRIDLEFCTNIFNLVERI